MNPLSPRASLHVLQWNCRGARDKLLELQQLALNCHIICLQESLLSAESNISISGFNSVRIDAVGPGLRGLCFFVKNVYSFSIVDLSGLSHPSVEISGILVNCSLDSPLIIINVYRHPSAHTPSSFFRNLFAFLSSNKYALMVGDFNAHHQAWNSNKQDRVGEYIYRSCESENIVILNDGLCTHIAPPGASDSIIDLSFATRELAILCEAVTESDPRGSDHFPINILISEVVPSSRRFCYKFNLNKKQLTALYCLLDREASRFEELVSSQTTLDPVSKYGNFVFLLTEIIGIIAPNRSFGSRKRNSGNFPAPAPWWNEKCLEAVETRRNLCRIYKTSPTLDNWVEFRRETARCRRVLKREKRLGWRNLCSSFTSRTPTTAVWRFIRSYKRKSLTRGQAAVDDREAVELQKVIIDKLSPSSCLHLSSQPLEEMKTMDLQRNNSHLWMDEQFKIEELDAAIASSKRTSAPGLDRIDYAIIRSFPTRIRQVLLSIFNEMFDQGLFHQDWHTSIVTFVPKSNNGFRPISLMSCLLKILEKMVYRRLQWTVETQFMLPEFQAGFRNFRSCIDNLTILTNHIHLACMNKSPLIAVFLDVAGAFDNVIPSILLEDLRVMGLPARICKFIENLLTERFIRFVRNGELSEPRTVHKGTPQGSILSPLLFNIYLRGIFSCLHPDTNILQYADDIVLYSWNSNIALAYESVSSSLSTVYRFLSSRGLDLSPLKSKCVVFNKRRGPPLRTEKILIDNLEVPQVSSVKFLGIILDYRLNGRDHLNYLIKKGNQIANVITSLTGTRWGAHPYLLLSLYRSIFRSSIEYGAQIFNLGNNRALFLKLRRQQRRVIRGALGLRQSTPIDVLLCEAREPPLNIRFSYLTTKYIMKCLARRYNLVIQSLRQLSLEVRTQKERIYLIKNVPAFKPYLFLICERDFIFRSVLPPALGYDFYATIPIPSYLSFNLPSSKTRNERRPYSVAEVRQKFGEFASPIIEQAISLYTDGSKGGDGLPVGAAVSSRDLGFSLKHKLPANTSIFTGPGPCISLSLWWRVQMSAKLLFFLILRVCLKRLPRIRLRAVPII